MNVAVTPNNWAGLLVVIMTVLGSICTLVYLFNWDNPEGKNDRENDRSRGMLG
jgi:hypothetical protein